MHDCYLPAAGAASTLLIYPPQAAKNLAYAAGIWDLRQWDDCER